MSCRTARAAPLARHLADADPRVGKRSMAGTLTPLTLNARRLMHASAAALVAAAQAASNAWKRHRGSQTSGHARLTACHDAARVTETGQTQAYADRGACLGGRRMTTPGAIVHRRKIVQTPFASKFAAVKKWCSPLLTRSRLAARGRGHAAPARRPYHSMGPAGVRSGRFPGSAGENFPRGVHSG